MGYPGCPMGHSYVEHDFIRENPPRRADPLLMLSSGQIEILKILAILFMVIDHVNRIIYDGEQLWMLAVGRMAFPLFCFIAAYHYEKPLRNFRKYVISLLVFGAISQPIYAWALNPNQLNIFFTLAAGLMAIWFYDNHQRFFSNLNKPQRIAGWAGVTVLWLLIGFTVDYHQAGILLIPCIVLWLRYQTDLILFCVLLATLVANYLMFYSIVGLLAYGLIFVVALMPLPIPRLPRYFYYAFYPGHLLLLKLAALYLLQ